MLCAYLVRLESGVVELLDGVLHVLVPEVLDGAGAVFEHVGEADVPGLPHVVLQVLPAARRRKAGHDAAVVGPPRRRTAAPTAAKPAAAAAATAAPVPVAAGELHSELVPVVVVAVAGVDRILGVPERRDGRFNVGETFLLGYFRCFAV